MNAVAVFVTGVVVGAIVMYLIARNSPNHFLKFRKFADAAYSSAKDKVKR